MAVTRRIVERKEMHHLVFDEAVLRPAQAPSISILTFSGRLPDHNFIGTPCLLTVIFDKECRLIFFDDNHVQHLKCIAGDVVDIPANVPYAFDSHGSISLRIVGMNRVMFEKTVRINID